MDRDILQGRPEDLRLAYDFLVEEQCVEEVSGILDDSLGGDALRE